MGLNWQYLIYIIGPLKYFLKKFNYFFCQDGIKYEWIRVEELKFFSVYQ